MSGGLVNGEVERDEQEGERGAVVASTFCRKEVAQMTGNVFVGILASNHSRGENGVRWGETGRNDEGGQEVEFRDERIN